jgi:hypothetical protein
MPSHDAHDHADRVEGVLSNGGSLPHWALALTPQCGEAGKFTIEAPIHR